MQIWTFDTFSTKINFLNLIQHSPPNGVEGWWTLHFSIGLLALLNSIQKIILGNWPLVFHSPVPSYLMGLKAMKDDFSVQIRTFHSISSKNIVWNLTLSLPSPWDGRSQNITLLFRSTDFIKFQAKNVFSEQKYHCYHDLTPHHTPMGWRAVNIIFLCMSTCFNKLKNKNISFCKLMPCCFTPHSSPMVWMVMKYDFSVQIRIFHRISTSVFKIIFNKLLFVVFYEIP